MDLSSIDLQAAAEQGEKMYLEHPVTGETVKDDDGNPMWIKVLGTDSKAYNRAVSRIASKRTRKGKGQITIEQQAENAADLLSELSVDWYVVIDGDTPKFSVEAAKQLYIDHKWIRQQVDDFAGDRANFWKAS